MKLFEKQLVFRKIWPALFILSYLLLSYYYFGGWWNSSLGTVLMLFFAYQIWGKYFTSVTGIKINIAIFLKSLVLAVVLTLASWFIMQYLGNKNGTGFMFSSWKNYYHDVFYVLNEEIILGAVLLFYLVKKQNIPPLPASVFLAVAFSFVHYIFYRWIFDETGILQITTLLTLFLVGIVRNNLILQTGHIAYSWALHFSWMVVMFGNHHFYLANNERVTEPARFNQFLGSTEMLVIAIFLAVLSIISVKKNLKF